MDLLTKLSGGTKNFKTIPWPTDKDYNIRIRVASDKDYSEATREADKFFENRQGPAWAYNANAYDNYKITQILYRVVTTDEEEPKQLGSFPQFESFLTPEIKDVIEEKWNDLQDECSPDIEDMSEQRMTNIINEVKKNPKILLQLMRSGYAKNQLILFLVSQLSNSPADKSLSSSQ